MVSQAGTRRAADGVRSKIFWALVRSRAGLGRVRTQTLPARVRVYVPAAYVNSLTSFETELPFEYYTLPFCQPPEGIRRIANTANPGTLLQGLRIENSPYNFTMKVRSAQGGSAQSPGASGPGEQLVMNSATRGLHAGSSARCVCSQTKQTSVLACTPKGHAEPLTEEQVAVRDCSARTQAAAVSCHQHRTSQQTFGHRPVAVTEERVAQAGMTEAVQ